MHYRVSSGRCSMIPQDVDAGAMHSMVQPLLITQLTWIRIYSAESGNLQAHLLRGVKSTTKFTYSANNNNNDNMQCRDGDSVTHTHPPGLSWFN